MQPLLWGYAGQTGACQTGVPSLFFCKIEIAPNFVLNAGGKFPRIDRSRVPMLRKSAQADFCALLREPSGPVSIESLLRDFRRVELGGRAANPRFQIAFGVMITFPRLPLRRGRWGSVSTSSVGQTRWNASAKGAANDQFRVAK